MVNYKLDSGPVQNDNQQIDSDRLNQMQHAIMMAGTR